MEPTYFSNQEDFRKWLKKNHKKEKELLVGFYKVSSGIPCMTWSESVDQALCYGWIDGIRKSIDEKRYTIRFTPRRKDSIWSAVNVKKVEELTKSKRMTPAGEKAYSYITENKSKIYSHEKEPVDLAPAYVKEFKKNKKAWKFFSTQAPSYQKVMIHWIMNAKQEKTQISRLQKTIAVSEDEKRMGW